MALDSWLVKVRSAVSAGLTTVRSTMPTSPKPSASSVGVLAFEVAALMSKLLHLWRSLSDANLVHLLHDRIDLPGVRKLVSDDDAFLLSLACAELIDSLRLASDSISILSHRCADSSLRQFGRRFAEFAESGRDPDRWVMGWKEMDTKVRKMERYIAITAALGKEMDELTEREHYLRRLAQYSAAACGKGAADQKVSRMAAVAEVQQRVVWQKQEVRRLKEASLWGRNFDTVVAVLARAAFTIMARIKQAFCLAGGEEPPPLPSSSLSRSLSSQSATVHPSSPPRISTSTQLPTGSAASPTKQKVGFFQANAAVLAPPPETLGGASLATRYANVIVVLERMIRTPTAIGPDARDDLYAMLPASVRSMLRARLRGVALGTTMDAGLAAEWRTALGKIMEWLGPMAHDMLRWQAERSFERRPGVAAAGQRSGVMVLQTLQFASREKAEAAVVELLVGLNYVWRFEMEMAFAAKAAAAAATAAPLVAARVDDDESSRA